MCCVQLARLDLHCILRHSVAAAMAGRGQKRAFPCKAVHGGEDDSCPPAGLLFHGYEIEEPGVEMVEYPLDEDENEGEEEEASHDDDLPEVPGPKTPPGPPPRAPRPGHEGAIPKQMPMPKGSVGQALTKAKGGVQNILRPKPPSMPPPGVKLAAMPPPPPPPPPPPVRRGEASSSSTSTVHGGVGESFATRRGGWFSKCQRLCELVLKKESAKAEAMARECYAGKEDL